MPTIPVSLLKQLYQRGSLRNTAAGWEFRMRNHLASANLIGLGLTVDDAAVAAEAIRVLQPGAEERTAESIGPASPLPFPVGVDLVVQVAGALLDPGPHRVAVQAETREIDTVTIPVQDTLAG